MSKFFFLNNLNFIYFILFLSLITSGYLRLGFALVAFSILFFFRKSKDGFKDTLKDQDELVLSPIFGQVVSVRSGLLLEGREDEVIEIRLKNGLLNQHGLYLPTSVEVNYLKSFKGTTLPIEFDTDDLLSFNIETLARTELTLETITHQLVHMRFLDRRWGKKPIFWLKSGDRGYASACFGYYPFGGTLIMYLPIQSEVLVFPGEKIVPGKSVLGIMKGIKDV